MSITRLRMKRVLPLIKENRRAYSSLVGESEYTNKPHYPPIADTSREAEKVREKLQWHKKIESLGTVEEKLLAINLPKYYGWHSLILREGTIPYNSLPLAQFITRTHCIKDLPDFYSDPSIVETTEKTLQEVKSQIEEALVIEHALQRRKQELRSKPLSPAAASDEFGRAVVQQVNRLLLGHLSAKHQHAREAQLELEPRVEAFWAVGQTEPPAAVRTSKESNERCKHRADEPVDRHVQYLGGPTLALRSRLPLRAPTPLRSHAPDELPVPVFPWDPRVLGAGLEHRHGNTVPGGWPGGSAPFGLLSFHSRQHLHDRPPRYQDTAQCLNVQAVLAGFAWTFAQACHQGFSTFTELSQPLATQTVITDGKRWSMSAFQLNTTLLHSRHALDNPRRNLCWTADETTLFQEIRGDAVIGFDVEALRPLVQFYANAPAERASAMRQDALVADIADNERRAWLEERYKHLASNRPRHRLPYEIYDWESIYKIAHNTRPLDKKRRPFELADRPFARRLDEHAAKYVPKKLRPDDPKNRDKFAKTFYP